MRPAAAALLAALLSAPWPAQAQPIEPVTIHQPPTYTPEPDTAAGTFSLVFENDVFFNTDRDYTNGVLATYTLGPQDTPDWFGDVARLLPFFTRKSRVRSTFELGQNIYTPTDISLKNPPLTDRPYAGFLYAGVGLVAEEGDRLDQLNVQLGVVGPASFAEQTQKFVHRAINDTIPQGWDTQLKNEPALELTYERSWRAFVSGKLLGFSFDIDPHVGAAIGNVYDYVNGGAMLRIGFELPNDFGPLRIDPSLPGSSFYEPSSGFSWYIFGGFDGRAMGRNIFLDGNSFAVSRSVDKNIFVGDAQFGAVVAFKQFRLTFTHVFRTKEYTTQPGVDQFGAVSLSVRF